MSLSWGGPQRRKPLRRVSKKRQAENRVRRAAVIAEFGSHPQCGFPGCPSLADDAHEVLSRARGGSITDVSGIVPLCRPHHDFVTTHPADAEAMGLSRSRYGGTGGAA